MGIVCRGAMHGFAALPSTIMDATAVELAPKPPILDQGTFFKFSENGALIAGSGKVMGDGTFFGASSEQNRSWEDSGMTISGL